MPKMIGCIKAFKVKNKNNVMSFCIYDEKLFTKYKAIWTKIENLKNIELNVLPFYGERQIKTKLRIYGIFYYDIW